jgi:hypothetical protein
MVHGEVVYGTISTFNSFVFMKRQTPGILYLSQLIPSNCTEPTMMKLLYYFSNLCTLDIIPCSETNDEGIKIHLTKALNDTSAAPKIPNPSIIMTNTKLLPPPTSNEYTAANPRRSPRKRPSDTVKNLDATWTKQTYLGCKGWKGTLGTGETVFAKLWDGWKVSGDDCEHEASIYLHLQDLWGTIIPKFLGCGHWGFCHILLLSYINVCCACDYSINC